MAVVKPQTSPRLYRWKRNTLARRPAGPLCIDERDWIGWQSKVKPETSATLQDKAGTVAAVWFSISLLSFNKTGPVGGGGEEEEQKRGGRRLTRGQGRKCEGWGEKWRWGNGGKLNYARQWEKKERWEERWEEGRHLRRMVPGNEQRRGDEEETIKMRWVGGCSGAEPQLRSRVGVGGEKLQIHRRAPLRRRSCGWFCSDCSSGPVKDAHSSINK